DHLTANVLLKIISKTILDSRAEVVRISLRDQVNTNTNILIAKKKENDISNFYEIEEDRDFLDSELKEVQSKLDHQINVTTVAQDNLATAESNYQRSKKISNKKIDNEDIDIETHRKELRERIEKLNSDLSALEDVSSSQTSRDKEVLVQLRRDIRESKSKLKMLGEGNSQTSLRQFVKQNDEKIHGKELEYKVIKDQVDFAKQNYEDLIIKKKDILRKKIKADQSIDILKPNVEFIKNLEIKIEQLKLLSLTVSPDVRFDSYAAAPDPIKKIGLILLVGYLVILEGLLLTLYLSTRFYFDNNIYDIDDLKGSSSNLKIIGNGPKYGQT
ncbi:MAG: hypothetical protein Q7U04_12495, partial [Bacteriovorax sp.]|nr:hypothetical protein [Bacteriovorax sp.]